MLLNVCITWKQNNFLKPETDLGRDRVCWGARPSHKLECFYMAAEHPAKQNLQHRKQNWAVFGGTQPSHKFECFWKVSYHPDEKFFNTVKCPGLCLEEYKRPFISTLSIVCITSKRNDSSTPQNELGHERGCWGARSAINLIVFNWLYNIQTKKLFNTVKGTGPCLGEHGPAISSNVFEKLHTIQMRRVFNTVKWAGPCLEEHDQPIIWTLLKVCSTSKRNNSSTPKNELGRDKGCWKVRPSHELECFYMAAEHPNKIVHQHREQNWAVFGRAQPNH